MATQKGFVQIQTADRNLQLIQDNIRTALNTLQSSPFVGGLLLSSVSLASGANEVPHTLGYTPSLVVPSLPDANVTLWVSALSASSITVNASGACSASLWLK